MTFDMGLKHVSVYQLTVERGKGYVRVIQETKQSFLLLFKKNEDKHYAQVEQFPGTQLWKDVNSSVVSIPNEDSMAEMYEEAVDTLARNSLER